MSTDKRNMMVMVLSLMAFLANGDKLDLTSKK